MSSIIATSLVTVAGLEIAATVYDAMFTAPSGWSVGHKPTGLYDIYNPQNQCMYNDVTVPYVPEMGTDPRDCLGYIPIPGTPPPPPAVLPSSQAIIKSKNSANMTLKLAINKSGFVVTSGGYMIVGTSAGWLIINPNGSTNSTLWGDPHVREADGSKIDWFSNKFPPKAGFIKKP